MEFQVLSFHLIYSRFFTLLGFVLLAFKVWSNIWLTLYHIYVSMYKIIPWNKRNNLFWSNYRPNTNYNISGTLQKKLHLRPEKQIPVSRQSEWDLTNLRTFPRSGTKQVFYLVPNRRKPVRRNTLHWIRKDKQIHFSERRAEIGIRNVTCLHVHMLHPWIQPKSDHIHQIKMNSAWFQIR